MTRLFDLLAAIHESVLLSTPHELRRACELIVETESLSADERDTLRAAFQRGPLEDGDVPSKAGRDQLIDKKFISKVVVNGEEGFNACTYRGARAYKLLEVMHG